MGRDEIEHSLREAYAARVRGDIDGISKIFGEHTRFRMAGSSQASPVAAAVEGAAQYRPLISQMIKTFELSEFQILSMVIEDSRAVVHWRAKVRSSITGDSVITELADIVEFKDDKVLSWTEFCDTALAAQMMGKK